MNQEEVFIDVRSYKCPFSFVKIKSILEYTNNNSIFKVLAQGEDSIQSILYSLKEEGCQIISCQNKYNENNIFEITFLKI